jgi:FkbM family methyltransferase
MGTLSVSKLGKTLRAAVRLRTARRIFQSLIPLSYFLKSTWPRIERRIVDNWSDAYILREDGLYMYLPARLDEMARFQLLRPIEQNHMVLRFCPTGGTSIDVGANIGEWTLAMSASVGSAGKVFAFEPVTDIAAILRKSIWINQLAQTEIVETALSDVTGSGIFTIRDDHSGMSGFDGPLVRSKNERTLEVPKTTLDAFVADRKLDRLDFIKIDVERHEEEVIAGAQETLTRFKPALLMEAGLESAAQRERIYTMLQKAGYVIAGIVVNHGIVACDSDVYLNMSAPFETGRHENVLFLST